MNLWSVITQMFKTEVPESSKSLFHHIVYSEHMDRLLEQAFSEAWNEISKEYSAEKLKGFDQQLWTFPSVKRQLQLFFNRIDTPNPQRIADAYRERYKDSNDQIINICEELVSKIEEKLQKIPEFREIINSREIYDIQQRIRLESSDFALSSRPPQNRPCLEIPLQGENRENILSQMFSTEKDLIIHGQPGIGKTFLLQEFARQTDALFILSKDVDTVKKSIRIHLPKLVILDDAHLSDYSSQFLPSLFEFRKTEHKSFRIIVSCWSSELGKIKQKMPTCPCFELSLLDRDTIAKVIYSLEITGPSSLINEIINQSVGKPGLAVTLCLLIKDSRKGLEEVFLGEPLLREVKDLCSFYNIQDSMGILATLSLGGKFGMKLTEVSRFLGRSEPEIKDSLTLLAAGGIVTTRTNSKQEQLIVVVPERLRFSLVKDYFFGKITLDFSKLVKQVPSEEEFIFTLIGAKLLGASGLDKRIQTFLMDGKFISQKIWQNYASLGKTESEWVLEFNPSALLICTDSFLYYLPEKTLQMLFDYTCEPSNRNFQLNQPPKSLEVIRNWISEASPNNQEYVNRRTTLLKELLKWSEEHPEEVTIVMSVYSFLLSPKYEKTELKPGSGFGICSIRGIGIVDDLRVISESWSPFLEWIRDHSIDQCWHQLLEILDSWDPFHVSGTKSKEEGHDFMLTFRKQMVRDIAPLVSSKPAYLKKLAEFDKDLMPDKYAIDLNEFDDFDSLYPRGWDTLDEDVWEKTVENVREIAIKWGKRSNEDVLKTVCEFEFQHEMSGLNGQRLTPLLFQAIADKAENCQEWFVNIKSKELSTDLLKPFVERIVREKFENWKNIWQEVLEDPKTKCVAIDLALTRPNFLPGLVGKALERISGCENIVKTRCIRGELSNTNILLQLLSHPDQDVQIQIAEGLWLSKEEIPTELISIWKTVVFSCSDQYFLRDIFKKDPDFAREWLMMEHERRDKVTSYYCEDIERNLNAASNVLSHDAKKMVLSELTPKAYLRGFLNYLINGNLELYALLFNNKKLVEYFLDPIANPTKANWDEMVCLALDRGYSQQDILSAISIEPNGWVGSESSYWDKFLQELKLYLSHQKLEIREIAQEAVDCYSKRFEQALEREQSESIYGYSYS